MKKIVGLGEILWDLLPSGKQLGGAVANFAYHVNALGEEGIVASAVGEDALGKEILENLDRLSLSTDYIARVPSHPTGTVSVELDQAGKPDYVIHEHVAWDFIPTTAELRELAATADAVCFGSLCQRSTVSRQTIQHFLAQTSEFCIRIFDINIRQHFYSKEVIDYSLRAARVLKINDEELPLLCQLYGVSGTEREIMDQIQTQFSLDLIVLTKGACGSVLFTHEAVSEHPGFTTRIADTVGAGDSFTAAVAAGLLRHATLDEINEKANKLAAFVCSKHGATPRHTPNRAKKRPPRRS